MTGALTPTTVMLVIGAFLFAALPHLAAMPSWLAVAIVVAAAWRAAVELFALRRPNWLIRGFLTFGGLALVILHYGTFWGRRAATVLLCVMIAAKLSEMFRLRDARVVAALGYFLIATQFLFSQQLVLFAYLVIGCALVTAALMRIQRDADCIPGPAERPAPKMAGVARTVRDGFLLMLLAVPFALVLFTLFPRLASPLWGMPENALDGRTGLSDEMSPGNIANLFADDSPAFRVSFDGPPPPRSERYWRGPVLWRFDGRTWKRLFYSNRAPERTPRPGPRAFSYTVQLEPSERRWLFSLDYPVRAPEDARLTADFELINRTPVTTLKSYDVISQPDFRDSADLMQTMRRFALLLPEGSNPRTRAHAQKLRTRYPDDRALIDAVLTWFNQEDFFYSLETAPLGLHGADEFLFDLRVGYCEYYASAFVVLMRAAGIPARIVTGYQGGFWQAADEYLLVRQSDAHAWAEVWLEGQGWTRVDPTAAVSPSRIRDGARSAVSGSGGWLSSEWLYQLRNQYDRLQNLWNRWILGFDARRQQNFLASLGIDKLPPGLKAALLVVLAGLVLVPLALLLQSTTNGRARPDRLDRIWLRLRGRLRRAGIRPSIGETPLELAGRSAEDLDNGHELITLADEYSRLKYGAFGSAKAINAFGRKTDRWRPRRRNPSALKQS